ncbi:probable WRKY transcription factor 32 isoform X1 [Arachis duranensis]|uniref:Probable WRKY transcription factor 32 isoform X1 n=1 Tax=Arachis duranensis TaxID=130453 RepID=A0A6P4B2M5_ARADU|nr:probable WRKY transcription factor 32 isoform X1 [Arachis duranensis]XP_025607554.1 probable WRKY transcription factor 32 isoform X1 [Arachis hypogaea]QHO50472.1 putative WRKY transcription factor [Arachis hypogaea]
MAEQPSSAEAVTEGAPELLPKEKDSEGGEGGNEQGQQGKASEGEERASESPCETDKPPKSSDKPPKGSNSGTLAAESPVVNNRSDAELQGSPATPNMDVKAESKETDGPREKETIASEAVQPPPTQIENQPQVSACSTPLSELSPTSVTQSLSSVPSQIAPKQKMPPLKINNVHVPQLDKKIPSGGKHVSCGSVARVSVSDGYSWRKYGQKQVKSPTGSRSYYRCTHSECAAKKIECNDDAGRVIDVVYKSQHSHDPPHKPNSTRESKLVSSSEPPNVENKVSQQLSIRGLKNSDPSPSKETLQDAPRTADKKRPNSSNLSDNGKVILKEEHVNEPEPKKRMKKDDLADLDSPVKSGKKSRFVVHAEGDVGISGDGYRWRKYGQKMVKGNPHPRNYYRCTSAGCPVRKHIETAVDNSNAVIITYKGVHDHDMPVPKKRHGPPSAPLVAAAAPASMNNSQSKKKPDSPKKQNKSTQWSVDTEGELSGEAMDLGGEKAMESARTLLSIGFEIKPC